MNHSQNGQDDRTPNPDRFVCRHECNEEGRYPHAQQRGDERRFTADPVAVVAKYRGANRPTDKADEIGAKGCKRRGQRILVGEVELAEDQTGGGAIDKKVIPFDGRADC